MSSRNPTSMQRYSQRYNPLTEAMTLHDAMDRLLADSFVRPLGAFNDMTRSIDTAMPIDMYEQNDKLIVKTPMPGVKPEDVNISIEDNVLTITGEIRSDESRPSAGEQTRPQGQAKGQQQGQAQEQQGGEQNANRNWYLREQQYARFVRAVTLPFPVQADKAEATMQDGVLTLELPKAEEAKQKKIQVKPK